MAPSHRRIKKPKMDQDFFKSLPTEIMFDIVLRLPTRSIMSCKCVCKPWRDLIKTREFVESHSSRSVPCLALQDDTRISKQYKIIEFLDSQNSWQKQCNVDLNFSFPHRTTLHSSANGLLLLINNTNRCPEDLFICNPILREYIKLPPPVENCKFTYFNVLGFGASKLSGEYKVVRLFYDQGMSQRKCEVYSVRRGSWRRVVTTGDHLRNTARIRSSVFSNGNLHWLVGPRGEAQVQSILCFDLEMECLNTFFVPCLDLINHRSICALGDNLCLCGFNSRDGVIIWSMKKYGDDKSWTMEFVITTQLPNALWDNLVLIKVEDGDIVFVPKFSFKLYYYSSKSKTIRVIDAAELLIRQCTYYKPSFVPLKTFTMQNNVISY